MAVIPQARYRGTHKKGSPLLVTLREQRKVGGTRFWKFILAVVGVQGFPSFLEVSRVLHAKSSLVSASHLPLRSPEARLWVKGTGLELEATVLPLALVDLGK